MSTSTATATATELVDVDELKLAWRAVNAGQFRDGTRGSAGTSTARHASSNLATWAPAAGERVVAVLGCCGSVGATTLALAVGLSQPGPVRVVECCSTTTSGLAAASTSELGLHPSGWQRGRREHVVLERGSHVLATVGDLPAPVPSDEEHTTSLTVLDIGWETGQLLGSDGWLAAAVRGADELVVVATATVPGVRRAAVVVDLLARRWGLDHVTLAVRGPRRRKWARGVEHAGGHDVRRVLDAGRYVEIPEDRDLAVNGIDSRPLPAPLLASAGRLSELIAGRPELTA